MPNGPSAWSALRLAHNDRRRTARRRQRTERNHKRLLEIIRSSGDDGLGKSELIRRTQFVDKRQRDEILSTLVEAGLVTMAMRPTPTKPALSYRAAGPMP
jgi:hypothetical protein